MYKIFTLFVLQCMNYTVRNLKCLVIQDIESRQDHIWWETPKKVASTVRFRFISHCTMYPQLLQCEWPAEPFLIAFIGMTVYRQLCSCWERSAAVHLWKHCHLDRSHMLILALHSKPFTVHKFGVSVQQHSYFSQLKMWPFIAYMEFFQLLGERLG